MDCSRGAHRGWKWEEERVTGKESQNSFQRKSLSVGCHHKTGGNATDRKMPADGGKGSKRH